MELLYKNTDDDNAELRGVEGQCCLLVRQASSLLIAARAAVLRAAGCATSVISDDATILTPPQAR